MTVPSRPEPTPAGSGPALAARAARPSVVVDGDDLASRYAGELLRDLGWSVRSGRRARTHSSPDASWAASGAMALTGAPDAPPQRAPAPVAACADGAARALAALASRAMPDGARALAELDGAALLGERAALSQPVLTRRGSRSPGGSCRIVACAEGWLALNLARTEDRDLLPAWLQDREPGSPPDEAHAWDRVERGCRDLARDDLVARGRLMGLAIAAARLEPASHAKPGWQHTTRWEDGPSRPPTPAPLVVDLSALWAGPLCGQLLAACGARVVKVESRERPDGARRATNVGGRRFFDLMNGQKQSVCLPFTEERGRRALRALVERADVVIEASRPRALAQLGIDAEDVTRRCGVTWISITGHGRCPPQADWVAFGDDAAAEAGLLVELPDGRPGFCGDAIADPLTGLHAALAGLSGWASGGRCLVELALSRVAARVRSTRDPEPAPGPSRFVARPPHARTARREAPPLGADTDRVLAELAEDGC
jgi:crotonobetainyl-CoA:carnitine CoA-transferase CaiB-like acyl-CoA transferase